MAIDRGFDLAGKTYVVVGGVHRLGWEVSCGLAAMGADVVAVGRVVGDRKATDKISLFGCDVRDKDQVIDLSTWIESQHETVFCVVNMVDLFFKDKAKFGGVAFSKVMETVVFGSRNLFMEFAEILGFRGSFINVVDGFATRPQRGWFAHSTAKATLLAMSTALSLELAPNGRSNALLLGPVLPPDTYDENLLVGLATETTLGRWGSPQDVLQAVVYLSQATYVTGTVLEVRGGSIPIVAGTA